MPSDELGILKLSMGDVGAQGNA